MLHGDEWDLIERIRRQVRGAGSVDVGIGDDAAVLTVAGDPARLLVTTDVLMEGVHFDLTTATPSDVGRKALAVNLSDMAAMAGRPTAAFVGLVLPRARGVRFADALLTGLLALAAEFDVCLAGGDTNIWDGPAVISVTLLGQPTGARSVLRSQARPGDWLMVTGALGGSLGGRHLHFTPRVQEAIALHATVDLHALIDLSDGLASDVQHLATQSQVGVIVDAASIPVHADVDASLTSTERVRRALTDGEDFELLMALAPEDGARLLTHLPFETPLTRIGVCTADAGCWLTGDSPGKDRPGSGGELVPLAPDGWQHRFQ